MAGVEPAQQPPPQSAGMTYIDKSDLHASRFQDNAQNKNKNKKKNPYDKQQIVMSEAVVEGKGDKDDSEINLPLDLNDSTSGSGATVPSNSKDTNVGQSPSIDDADNPYCKYSSNLSTKHKTS